MRSAPHSLLGAVLLGAFSLWIAGAPVVARAENDPPDRVARMSVVDGDVGLQPAGTQGWTQAQLNRPLTTGDRLWVPADARAELELGGAEIRLDGDSGFSFLDLGNNHAQAQLTQGTLNLRVRRLYQGQSYEIDTPTLAFVTDQTGEFRIDIGPGGHGTQVTVYRGEARVYGRDQARQTLYAGQSYRFADSSLASVETFGMPQEDSFDRWCFTRDRRLDRALADNYIPEGVIGGADLDEYGNWQSVGDYGNVWYPRDVPVGWAPYRDGHWVYVAPWGWTWVDDAPWGFAPFHYGRWVWADDAWGWLPGPRFVRPCYAPALVAFVGGGGWSVGVSLGGPPIGWYPLGPDDIYRPWYYGGPRYFQQVNITNIRIVNQTVIQRVDRDYQDYQHGRPPHAGPGFGHGDRPIPPRGLTAVPHDVFVGARPVAGHLLRGDRLLNTADRGSLRQVTPPRPLPVSLIGVASHPAPRVPQGLFERQVLAHRAPPALHAGLPAGGAFAAGRGGTRPGEPVALRSQDHVTGNVRVLGGIDMARTPRSQPQPLFRNEPRTLPQPQRLQPAEPVTGRAGGPPSHDAGLPAGAVPSARWAPHAWQSGHGRPAPGEIIGQPSAAPSRPSADYGRTPIRPDRPASSPWRGNPPSNGRPETGYAPPQSRPEPSYPQVPTYRPAYGNTDNGRASSQQMPAYRPEPANVPRQAYRPEPAYAPQPAYRPAPAYRPEPVQPAYRHEPAYAPQPVSHPAPAQRVAPSRSAPRPDGHHDGGGMRDH